jgi:exo-beta-1,3-glucanase (GH17 family)
MRHFLVHPDIERRRRVLGAATMDLQNRMAFTLSLRWSLVCLAYSLCVACGFGPTPSGAPPQPVAGSPASSAGSSGVGGNSAAGGSAGGASAGTSPTPTGGDGGAAQGGQAAQGGTSASAGSGGTGGMSVAGGPPVFSNKPLLVVAYSPYRDGQAPGGAQPSQSDVKADLQMLKPLVDGVRVYGTDGANAYIPALCDELGIDLHLGAWIDGLPSDEPNVHALAKIVNESHPSLKTAIVGNEVLARSAKNMVTETRLIELINLFRADVKVTGVKVAAADTYPQWMMKRPNLAAAVDLVIWHTYAWWAGADIANAYMLVSSRYDDMLAAYPGKPILLGETGWPSQVDHMSVDKTTTAVGSEANQAKFYREALAGMRARNLPMWMFSAIDEKWKGTSGEGEVGAHWGIWDSARQPKAAATEILAMVK